MGIIKAFKLGFDYLKYDEDGNVEATQRAVNDVNLDIEAGDFVAVLGHNGSGKSTLAKQINALLIPSEGTMWVDDMDTAKEPELWKIRQKAGMVFQNPDNQIIGTVVEEDVGFGPENMGVPTDEIWKRVDDSLKKTGMTAYARPAGSERALRPPAMAPSSGEPFMTKTVGCNSRIRDMIGSKEVREKPVQRRATTMCNPMSRPYGRSSSSPSSGLPELVATRS